MKPAETEPVSIKPPSIRREVWMCMALAVVGLLTYINTLPNEYVFDDEPNILGNKDMREFNWRAMLWTSRPTVEFSLALNYALDSALREPHPDDRYPIGCDPRGYHVFNMTVHILAALLLFGLVRRTLLLPQFRERIGPHAAWLAFVTALLWLVHPLNTQAVTYVIQRGESMMALFFLLTLYAALRHWTSVGGARFGWMIVAILACLAGMATKQVMVGAPLVVLLYDWTFFGGHEKRVFRRRAVLYAGLYATWAVLIAVTGSGIVGKDSSAGFAMPVMSWWRYATSEFLVILHYLRLSFVPYPLVLDYMWLPSIPIFTPRGALLERVLIYVVLPGIPILVLVIASLIGAWRRKWWGFLGLAFFIILGPTSSIMPIADLAFEHRMYLPLTCVICVTVMLLYHWLGRVNATFRDQVGLALALVIAAIFAWLTVQRNAEYQNGVTIWTTVTERAPRNPRGWQNLGGHLDDLADRTDDPQLREQRKAEALWCFEKTIQILPQYHQAHFGIAGIYNAKGQELLKKKEFAGAEQAFSKAIDLYREAISLEPRESKYRYELGIALFFMGDLAGSEQAFDEAIRLRPEYPKALNYRGLVYIQQGRMQAAIESFRAAIEHGAEELEAYLNLALALNNENNRTEAISVLEKAIVVEPIDANAKNAMKRIKELLKRYRHADQPDPSAGAS